MRLQGCLRPSGLGCLLPACTHFLLLHPTAELQPHRSLCCRLPMPGSLPSSGPCGGWRSSGALTRPTLVKRRCDNLIEVGLRESRVKRLENPSLTALLGAPAVLCRGREKRSSGRSDSAVQRRLVFKTADAERRQLSFLPFLLIIISYA